jgi:hypothetical protein
MRELVTMTALRSKNHAVDARHVFGMAAFMLPCHGVNTIASRLRRDAAPIRCGGSSIRIACREEYQ